MVAKSFQSMEFLTEPYEVKGKMYIRIRNPKTGTERQVRWYSKFEYEKMYPEEKVSKKEDSEFKTQKEVLGFTKGYITIFKGETYENKEWLKNAGARYTRIWGWYITSEQDVPEELPEYVEPIKLEWDLVGKEDGNLKPEDQIAAVIDNLLYEQQGEFVGEVGEKLDLWLTVEKAINLDSYYGSSTMHIMYDDCGNTYVWTTSAKSWSEGTEHHISATVKDHKIYKGVYQTVLTRCRSLN